MSDNNHYNYDPGTWQPLFPCNTIRITVNAPMVLKPCPPDCPFNRNGKCITSKCLFRNVKVDNLEPVKLGEKEVEQ